jgi:hypothetical protein
MKERIMTGARSISSQVSLFLSDRLRKKGDHMKVIHFIFLITAFIGISCSHHQERTPASVKAEKDTIHEKFQGVFDRSY